MQKFSIFGASMMMLVPGILYLVAPQLMLETPQIHLNTVNEFHAFRSAMKFLRVTNYGRKF